MLQIKNLSLKLGKRFLFRELSLDFELGKIHGLFGLNGAGKTSLLKTLYGIHKHKGTIHYQDRKLSKNDIAYLEAENYFYPNLSGKEYLEIFQSDIKPTFDVTLLAELLNVPLDQSIDEYSSGTKKKIAFLAILKLNRDIYFLDEPFKGLDQNSILVLKNIFLELKKKGCTLFLVAHEVGLLQELSDDFLIIDQETGTQKTDINGLNAYLKKIDLFIQNKVRTALGD